MITAEEADIQLVQQADNSHREEAQPTPTSRSVSRESGSTRTRA